MKRLESMRTGELLSDDERSILRKCFVSATLFDSTSFVGDVLFVNNASGRWLPNASRARHSTSSSRTSQNAVSNCLTRRTAFLCWMSNAFRLECSTVGTGRDLDGRARAAVRLRRISGRAAALRIHSWTIPLHHGVPGVPDEMRVVLAMMASDLGRRASACGRLCRTFRRMGVSPSSARRVGAWRARARPRRRAARLRRRPPARSMQTYLRRSVIAAVGPLPSRRAGRGRPPPNRATLIAFPNYLNTLGCRVVKHYEKSA